MILDRRALNRALLARQHLLRRTDDAVDTVVGHLAGMQSQSATAPYFGLWSRIKGFAPEALSSLIADRTLVRATAMRGTIHLLPANDAHLLRSLVQPSVERALANAARRKAAEAVDRDSVVALVRRAIGDGALTTAELRVVVGERWPSCDAAAVAELAHVWLPLVQVPPRGLWGKSGKAAFAVLDRWVRPPKRSMTLTDLVRRYLAAFGPASVADAQTWAGLTRLKPVFEELRPTLATFSDAAGVELFDLPEAPRPAGSTKAPIRLLSEYDNMLLSYADRSRIIDEAHRSKIFAANGIIGATVLIDGFVAGAWRIDDVPRARGRKGSARETKTVRLTVSLFADTSAANRSAIEKEGAALLAFAEPEAAHDVAFV